MARLSGRVALVTGSSRGIGQQVVVALAKEGAEVILHGRSKAHVSKTLDMLKPTGATAHVVEGDLASADGVQAVIWQVRAVNRPVDILYNNAAVQAKSQPIYEHPFEQWHQLFQVNVWSLIALCNAFVPPMKQRGWGRVVNVTSGIANQPNLAPYSVSKAAVDKYTRDLAADLKGTNVLASYLDPGWLKTDMGGPNALNEVEDVLPGALVPVLLPNDGPNGQFFAAQDYRGLSIDEALQKAMTSKK